ncbi:ATP-binding protein [Tepidibacillus marianensis]|uniref:ATP-binding protein n=1 Tax=Tepidibacillus marianensis TaxID=3131995 RepID=UPI0030D521EC
MNTSAIYKKSNPKEYKEFIIGPIIYVATYIIVFLLYFFFKQIPWNGNLQFHTLSETIGTILSFFVGVISLVRFYSKRNNTFLFIGTGFVGTALIEGFHTVITTQYDMENYSFPTFLVMTSNLTSRIFLAMLLFFSFVTWKIEEKHGKRGVYKDYKVYIFFLSLIVLSLFYHNSYYPSISQSKISLLSIEIVNPPFKFVYIMPLLLYSFTLIGYLRKGNWKYKGFEHWLLLSIIFSIQSEVAFFFSTRVIDITIAHVLRNISYFLVFIGLVQNMYHLFRQAEESTNEIKKINEILKEEIHERKMIEGKLKESEERYRLLVEFSPDVIAVETDGKWSYINTTGRKLLGATCKKTEIIGRPVFNFIHPDEHEQVKEQMTIIQSQRKNFDLLESKFVTLDGRLLDMEVQTIPVIYQGKPSIQFVARNVTERKKTEELLRHSEKLSAVGQLAAGIAHEIRNPLTSLKGFIQLIQSGIQGKEEYFQIMLSELRRIETIISELLVLAKPQGIHFEQKDLRELLQHVIALVNTQAIMKNILIRSDFDPELPYIQCEENQLKQVFINLFKNSVEAMANGGTINVTVRKIDTDHFIRITIKDQGVGIPKEFLSRIGEPFFTTKEKGTGLGMMVSHRIVKNHGGKIQIESMIGEGTTVYIDLPITLEE